MEIPNIRRLCRGPVTRVDYASTTRIEAKGIEALYRILDNMGMNSSKAQGLRHVITSSRKFMLRTKSAEKHRVYIAADLEQGTCLGFVKMGIKNLFYRDNNGIVKEIAPLCCLDFYVHESQQRKGWGKRLFQYMLCAEQSHPAKIAYDRPSPKLQAFLSKHYNLDRSVPQNNSFLVFNRYFTLPSNLLSEHQIRPTYPASEKKQERPKPDVTENVSSTMEGETVAAVATPLENTKQSMSVDATMSSNSKETKPSPSHGRRAVKQPDNRDRNYAVSDPPLRVSSSSGLSGRADSRDRTMSQSRRQGNGYHILPATSQGLRGGSFYGLRNDQRRSNGGRGGGGYSNMKRADGRNVVYPGSKVTEENIHHQPQGGPMHGRRAVTAQPPFVMTMHRNQQYNNNHNTNVSRYSRTRPF